jgi:hypothetical protein
VTIPLRVLMASWEEVAEPILREAIEEGGHQLTIVSPWRRVLIGIRS